jgi:hypothetical protein
VSLQTADTPQPCGVGRSRLCARRGDAVLAVANGGCVSSWPSRLRPDGVVSRATLASPSSTQFDPSAIAHSPIGPACVAHAQRLPNLPERSCTAWPSSGLCAHGSHSEAPRSSEMSRDDARNGHARLSQHHRHSSGPWPWPRQNPPRELQSQVTTPRLDGLEKKNPVLAIMTRGYRRHRQSLLTP